MAHRATESALQRATSYRDLPRVQQLIATGADPNEPGPLGHTALHTAAARDEPTIAQALIEAGAHVDATDDAGNTPLLVAVTAPKPALSTIDVLLSAHANADVPNQAGATPRTFALSRKLPTLRSRFPAVPDSGPSLPDIEIVASTPSKLTLAIDGSAVTFPGELVLIDGSTDRILRLGDMAHFDDGTALAPELHPLILSYLVARRFSYDG